MTNIRGRIKQIGLMARKDTISALATKGQTEVEYGVRMLAYMVLFRSMEIGKLRDKQIIAKIKGQLATEARHTGDLAERRRRHMYMLLLDEQKKIKK